MEHFKAALKDLEQATEKELLIVENCPFGIIKYKTPPTLPEEPDEKYVLVFKQSIISGIHWTEQAARLEAQTITWDKLLYVLNDCVEYFINNNKK